MTLALASLGALRPAGASAAEGDAAPSRLRGLGLDVRSKYEDVLISAALLRHELVPEPHPEGKIIERIIIDASDVILGSELPLAGYVPWTLANKVHVRTQPYIIAQELLFRIGQPYQADLFEESGRNLRALFIMAVARLVPVRGSAPDRVAILVVTKDQWSLRLNTNFELDQARLDSLSFSFSENNLAGRNKTLAVNFALDPGRYTLGLSYLDPRVWSSRHSLQIGAGIYLPRSGAGPEGGNALLSVGRPLYSLRTEWGWDANLSWDRGKARTFSGGDLVILNSLPFTFVREQPTAPGGPGVLGLVGTPAVYGYQNLTGSVEGIHSSGVRYKFNVTFGLQWSSVRNWITEEFPSDAPASVRANFTYLYMPRSEDASGPYLNLTAYEARYVRLRNIETFALSEDFRLGYTFTLQTWLATPVLGLTSQFVSFAASASYVHYAHDDLLTYAVALSGRLQSGVYPQPPSIPLNGVQLVNEDLSATIRNVSPRLGFFRLHTYGRLRLRGHDLNNLDLTLGSDNGLRGFAPRYFPLGGIAHARYGTNVELRTLALNLWTLHVGGVVFYDGGDAPTSLWQAPPLPGELATAGPAWHQDVGVGVRILFPQFNRDVLRLDLAFPMELSAGVYAPRFSAAFGQAF